MEIDLEGLSLVIWIWATRAAIGVFALMAYFVFLKANIVKRKIVFQVFFKDTVGELG